MKKQAVFAWIILLSLCSFALSRGDAATIEYKFNATTNRIAIRLSGTITSGDFQRFESTISTYKDGTIFLSSDGGLILEALAIGQLVRERNFETVVLKNRTCASSCGLIWLAGTGRTIEGNGRVGFHAAYILQKKLASESGTANALVGAYLERLGLNSEAIIFATNAAPNQMKWLSKIDASKTAISTSFVPRFGAIDKRNSRQKPNISTSTMATIPKDESHILVEKPSKIGSNVGHVGCKLHLERIVGDQQIESLANMGDVMCLEKLRYDESGSSGLISDDLEKQKSKLN